MGVHRRIIAAKARGKGRVMETVLKIGKKADPQDVTGAIFTLMGHNVFHHQTLISAPSRRAFDREVGQAAARMKKWLGYKEEDCEPTYGPQLDDILLGRVKLTKAMHKRRVERGFEQPAPQAAAAHGGLAFPVTVKNWTKLGFPGQGTHAKDFNKKQGTDNWQSENAVDIGCPKGTPLVAVADGTIGNRIGPLNSKDPRLLGLRLYVVTKDNQFYYAHLSSIGVQAGQQVKRGQVVGKSGVANGVAHLHIAAEHGNPAEMFF